MDCPRCKNGKMKNAQFSNQFLCGGCHFIIEDIALAIALATGVMLVAVGVWEVGR